MAGGKERVSVGERVVIFATPIAGRGKGRVRAEGLAGWLRAAGREGPGVVRVAMGTANVVGRDLGVGLAEGGLEDRAVAAMRGRKVVRLDVGSVMSNVKSQMSNEGEDAERERQLFLLMVGVGIDGEI